MNTWTWSWAIRNLVAELIMPPGIWIAIGLAALILFRKRRRIQAISVGLCFAMIWLTSTTFFAHFLVRATDAWMHWPTPVDIRSLPKASINRDINKQQSTEKLGSAQGPQVIVILGGGRRKAALDNPEYQFQDVSKESMERLRMGARLAKHTNLPILVTGGAPDATSQNEQSEAKLMTDVLENELNIKPTWIEGKSTTTKENASLSAQILKVNPNELKGNVQIYLVTHFWHMPRAQGTFEKEGFKVAPIPLSYSEAKGSRENKLSPVDFAPSSSGISRIRQVWHEVLGKLWYTAI